MSYTPVELRHVHVGRSLFGYNRATVEQVISDVAESFEATWRERGELADQVEALEKEVGELRRREELLTHTLVAAEQAASDIRDRAKREAEALLADARDEAREITRSAQNERERLGTESRRIEAMLRATLEMLEQGADMPAMREAPPREAAPATPRAESPDATAAPATPADGPPAAATRPAEAATPAAEPPVGEPPASEDLPVLPWPREDTREFEPVKLPPVVEDEEDEPSAERSAREPALPKVPGRESRDFDWGE